VFRLKSSPVLLCSAIVVLAAEATQPEVPILTYIHRTWATLTRSHQDLAAAAIDPKLRPFATGQWPVYVPKDDFEKVAVEIRREMKPADFAKIELRSLPQTPEPILEHGLLYLPRPYVVPGGRFNEMYGWDSFFIQMGLLRDGNVRLAMDMADNFLYEIRQYGKILNANRTYYLTRSQPPFLTEMLLAVYRATNDRQWLQEAVPAAEQYYRFWTSEPHLVSKTHLSRYFDTGEGPAPEVVAGEHDSHGAGEYDLIKRYFRTHRISDYDVSQYYDASKDRLTPLFYKGDRSMRESGFDPSSRFGPFSVDIIHYNPVCLNSLLYLMETQMAEIMTILNQHAAATAWRTRAQDRAASINQLFWSAKDGLYYDYDFVHERVRVYPFLTTFYPLWIGVASHEQAAQVVRNLPLFERAGGLQTSTKHSGDQWDAPFGWAPLEWIAVQGLRRYGYNADADRISRKFLTLVLQEFRRSGTMVEKYDVVRRSTDVTSRIQYGYHSNQAGFGWTNAVFRALLDELPEKERQSLLTGRDPI
jgi:alpha,alpha-trehalase